MTPERRRFDALVLGERRTSPAMLLPEAEIVDFAKRFDPQWFHSNPLAARSSAFGGLIASGTHLLALWRLMDHGMNGDIDYQCAVALEHVEFRQAARPGDGLVLHSEITALRRSSSPARGVVTMGYRMENQHGQTVMSLSSVNLVYR